MFKGAASRLLPSLLAALIVGVCPAFAQAQSALASADRAYDEGALAEAGRGYEDALAAGGLTRAEVARVHLRLAVLAALGDEQARFERHAEAALALDPELPAPALNETYAGRFSEMAGEARRLRLQLSQDGGRVSVEVHGPPNLVRTVTLHGPDGWTRTLAWQGERLSLRPPPAARPLAVEGLDAHGNVVARAGVALPSVLEPVTAETETTPAPETVPLAPEVPDAEGPSILESPWLWIGVGLLAVGIGLVVGLTAFGERYVLDAPVVR